MDPWEAAVSFEGYIPPNQAELIEERKSNKVPGLEFYLYRDEQGNYYYQSNSQMQFETEMEQSQKNRKKKR